MYGAYLLLLGEYIGRLSGVGCSFSSVYHLKHSNRKVYERDVFEIVIILPIPFPIT